MQAAITSATGRGLGQHQCIVPQLRRPEIKVSATSVPSEAKREIVFQPLSQLLVLAGSLWGALVGRWVLTVFTSSSLCVHLVLLTWHSCPKDTSHIG